MKNFLIALQFLTRIPIKVKDAISQQDYGCSMVWFPAVGFILGLLLVLIFKSASALFPRPAAEILVITAYMFLTGAIHIDGLADTLEGLYGGRGNKEKTLAIMKDSAVGAIGALAIALDIILRFVLLDTLPLAKIPQVLIATAVLGRWAQVLFTLNSDSASKGGAGEAFSHGINPGIFILSTLIMLSINLFFLKPFTLLCALLFICALVLLMKNYFRRVIGGITGDTIGAANEVAEISVLLWMSTAAI
jgi:adenosylcobinamide-GDP ribazoletransferase